MTKYKLIKEKLYHENSGDYIAYGIAVYAGKTPIRKISDVSTDKHRVRKLCRLCNKLKLDPEHINDVVSDLICL